MRVVDVEPRHRRVEEHVRTVRATTSGDRFGGRPHLDSILNRRSLLTIRDGSASTRVAPIAMGHGHGRRHTGAQGAWLIAPNVLPTDGTPARQASRSLRRGSRLQSDQAAACRVTASRCVSPRRTDCRTTD